MRLPWNKKYMEISFHIILTGIVLVGMGGLLLHLSAAKNVILQTARGFLAVFAPVLWAFFFALLLEPMTAFWQKQYEAHCSSRHRSHIQDRRAGTLLAYLSVGCIFGGIGSILVRRLGDMDVQGLAEQLSGYIRQAGDLLVLLNLKLAELGILQNVEGVLSAWTEQATAWVETQLLQAAAAVPRIGRKLPDLLLGGVAAFYLLMEKERMEHTAGKLLPILLGKRLYSLGKAVLREISFLLNGYFSGQLLDAAIMAVLFSVAFSVTGLPHGILLGIFSGFSNLIPYLGAMVAFLLAILAGLLSGTPMKALYASILILLLQQIDSIFLVPRVVGRRVELHPVLVLFSLAICGRLFGFWGLLFAVPLGAFCKRGLLYVCAKRNISKSDRDCMN